MNFEEKLNASIELLRKTEKLALQYSTDGFYLAFSGGKDSQALYHVAVLAGVKFKAHFSPTTVDPPEVIRFIRIQYPDVEFVKPKMSIYEMAKKKGIPPTQLMRWCCAEFKEKGGAGTVTLIGIRKAESTRRSKRNEVEVSGRKFSGSLDGFAEWQKEQIAKKMPKNMNIDEFSAEQESEIRCIDGKDKILVSPIIDWTDKDVWHFLNDVVKVPHCSLYDEGFTRIGCIMCPMANLKRKRLEIKRWPHVYQKWVQTFQWLMDNKWVEQEPEIRKYLNTPERRIEWWMSGMSMKEFISKNYYQLSFFD